MSVYQKYHKLEFSGKEDDMLIEMVKANPVLYTKELKNFKNLKIKNKIWTKIGKEMKQCGYKKTAEQCKKRWTNLRDYYLRRKRLGAASEPGDENNDKFQQFHFLDDSSSTDINFKATTNPNDMISEEDQTYNKLDMNSTVSQVFDNRKTELIEIATNPNQPKAPVEENRSNIVTAKARHTIERDIITPNDTKRVHRKLLEQISQGRSESMSLLRDITIRSLSAPQTPEDHIDLFFRSLASTAKTLSPWNLPEAKNKLFNIMSEIEFKDMSEKYNTTMRISQTVSALPSPPISHVSFSGSTSSNCVGSTTQNNGSDLANIDNISSTIETTTNRATNFSDCPLTAFITSI